MQLELFKPRTEFQKLTYAAGTQLHECIVCKVSKPVEKFETRTDRGNYMVRKCLVCHAEYKRTLLQLHKTAPPKPTKCDCCHKEFDGFRQTPQGEKMPKMHLDHCHTTNKFRGWLCIKCNTGIGILGDTLETVNNAIVYLEAYHERTGLPKKADTHTPKDNL